MSNPVALLIDAQGGTQTFAEKVGRTPNNVRVWRHRGVLPRDAWPEVLEAFPDVTLDALKATERAA